MRRACAATIVLLALGSGCTLTTPLPAEARRELLEKLPDEVAQRPHGSASILLVASPEAEPAIDTERIAYRERPHEIAYFNDRQWAERPAQMIHGLLARTLERTRYFREVAIPPHFTGYDYRLETRLLTLIQDYTSKPPVLHAAMGARLVGGRDARTVASREFSVDRPMAGEGPHAGVVAANDALAQLLGEIAAFIIDALDATAAVNDGRRATCAAACRLSAGSDGAARRRRGGRTA